MARGKKSGIHVVAAMPWPAGIVLGILAYVAIRYGIGWYFSSTGGPMLSGLGKLASSGAYAPLAWAVLGICWLAAGMSYVNSRKRKRLLETQNSLDSLKAMSWREFETLVGEAFRRHGYAVKETGGGGKDGGIDLILRKDGRTELVQCKQWKTQQVKVHVVREMWGLVSHHKADAVKIVCVGTFSADAENFAKDKAIELINGERLMELVRSVQTSHPISNAEPVPAPKTAANPTCPRCGAAMYKRFNRQTSQIFWGCINYPRCKGTQSV
jgi:restriction system protein